MLSHSPTPGSAHRESACSQRRGLPAHVGSGCILWNTFPGPVKWLFGLESHSLLCTYPEDALHPSKHRTWNVLPLGHISFLSCAFLHFWEPEGTLQSQEKKKKKQAVGQMAGHATTRRPAAPEATMGHSGAELRNPMVSLTPSAAGRSWPDTGPIS